MLAEGKTGTPLFQVVDAMAAPHRGSILRLRLKSGRTPSLKEVKGGRFTSTSPKGEEIGLTVIDFAQIWGRPSQARFDRTGRLDVVAVGPDGPLPVSLRWTVTGPA